MTIEKQMDINRQLVKLIEEHPSAKIVTDVGASMISGWGDLKLVSYIKEYNVIELEFH